MVAQKYVLIGVEGNHDQAFICKTLRKHFGFKNFNGTIDELDKFWRKFVPTYPKRAGPLHIRLDMPSILESAETSLAVYAGGGSNLSSHLSTRLSDMDYSKLHAFGIIVDSDKESPQAVAQTYIDEFRELFPDFPEQLGRVSDKKTRLGIYVLPDNQSTGVLETLLCQCGETSYPTYMRRARSYIEKFSEDEIKQLKWKPFDKEKATIATVVSMLKPGKTNTVSISDDQWICPETIGKIPELTSVVSFLEQLLLS